MTAETLWPPDICPKSGPYGKQNSPDKRRGSGYEYAIDIRMMAKRISPEQKKLREIRTNGKRIRVKYQ